MKKNYKKIYIWGLMLLLLSLILNSFSNSAYISRLIKTIDWTRDIELLINEKVVSTYDFDDVIPEFVYGQIVDVKKPWHYLLPNNKKKFNETNIEIHYLRDGKIAGKAKVFTSSENADEYIFFMNNVYYKGSDSFNLLLDQSH
ncbi:MAG: hypothetical protein GX079_00240 [Tissierellia bacterium]|nr:hypothetical protein [Tissierellia bacterium]